MSGGLRGRLHALALVVAREHTQPGRVAAAVFVGCVVGCSPLFGLHLPVAVALAWLLGLNKLIVYGAANVSVPPMVPLIGFASVQLGARLLEGRWLSLARADFASGREMARRFFSAWLVGGLGVGAAVGAVAAAVVYVIVRRRTSAAREIDQVIDQAIGRAAARYAEAHPRFRWYARLKYRMDPCYRAIAPLVPEGAYAVDLGCGLGMLSVLLGELGGERRALGVEWDRAKAECGRQAARGLPAVEIVEGDAREHPLPPCDVITLVDVLHYYDPETQSRVLARCRAALRPGGRLLVREGDRQRRGGARWTRAVERLVTSLGWNRGPAVRFRPVAELRAELEQLGLGVRLDEVAGRLHPGNVLLVAELPAELERAAT